MQASNGETKGLGGPIERGQPSWEKAVVGDLATRCHAPPIRQCMVIVAYEKSCAWRRVIHWLSSRLLPACRSGDNEPNGGVADRNGAFAIKVHRRVFLALQRSDGDGGVLELPRTKVVMAGIRHNH